MNICFFNCHEHFGRAMVGGIPRATSLLAGELRRRGHCVEFYHSGLPPSRFNRSARASFCSFCEEHKIDVAVWQWTTWSVPFPLENLPCRLITVWHQIPIWGEQVCADKIIRRLKLRSRLAQRIVRSKLCCSLARKLYGAYRACFFFSYALRHGDKFVLLSERFIPEFAPAKKFPQKVCAIPNIAPFEAQNVPITKKKELLWLGRVEFTHKRPDYMLQIWQRLQDRFPDWSLRFVGDGPYLPELIALAKDLGAKNVAMGGGYQDPIPYYRSAPIYCMTSTDEGFGLTLVEAQAYGCVPIAFDSYSAVHDIIDDGVNGALVPPFDLDAYAEKLAELMSDPELLERLARNGQKSISKFSAEAIGDKWKELLGGGYRKKKELLWLGRVEFTHKRPDYMLQIWQRLQDRFPEWSLRFVGDGPYLQELKALAEELGVQRVSFESFQDPVPYYRSASIFCMTSAYEGFGLVLVEAQAFGCVPVAFDSFSAVHDIIEDGENGALVPAFDIEKYAEKLAELMSNPELRVRLATNAQESVARFSPEAIGEQWEKLLEEVVRK